MPQPFVAALNALPDGQPYPIDIGGTKILLIRQGDAVHAIGAACPHAGAPLAEGVVCGDRIICPWHKATFSIRTGAMLEPPAVDDLPRCEVEVDGGNVRVTLSDVSAAPATSGGDERLFAIIGAGAAGALAAQTLRQTGFGGRIVMLDRENRVPYDRTLLSKYHLSGQPGAEKTPLQSQSFYQQHHIERRTAEVTTLDATTKTIRCADGTTLSFDAALLATGATPIVPKLAGADLGNVFVLRSKVDADAILAQAERSERAVILGASFIGMEVAASLRERGLQVTVVGKEQTPFQKQLGERIGRALVSLHERKGVGFRLGQEVQALQGEGNVRTVTLRDGEQLPADLVVIGFGVKPATAYLKGVPLNEDGSVTVDASLRAAEGLYAAGDIARFPRFLPSPSASSQSASSQSASSQGASSQGVASPSVPSPADGALIRVEHWRVAQQHGRIAALNMAGHRVRYDSVPVFWTIQYMKRVDYIGHATEWDDVIIHGDLEKPEFLAYYVKDGMVTAAAGMDRDQDTAALIYLLEQRRDWTPAALGPNPSTLLQARCVASYNLPDSGDL